MRLAARLALLAVASLGLAGCLSNPLPVQDAEAAHAGAACPGKQSVNGFEPSGAPTCAAPFAGYRCAAGEVVVGFGAEGSPECKSVFDVAREGEPQMQQHAEPTSKEVTQEVSSNLKVIGIYGVRNGTSSAGLWDLKINVELSAGALPMDLARMVIRYSDGQHTRNYVHAPGAAPDGGPSAETFDTVWIRGDGTHVVMESGDLVQLHFNVVAAELPVRTSVMLALIPETGSPVATDFKTPATYSTDTVVTLR